MIKQLAQLEEVQQGGLGECMERLNRFAREQGLTEYTTFSRVWEYPWLWRQLEAFAGLGLHLLDIGSERSPFPWFLATRGFGVTVSDVTPSYWRLWGRVKQRLGVAVERRLLDAQKLDVPTASVDIYLSVSVIEHVPDKRQAVAEAARVLRPGGLLVMTFDVCEPEMGMTFPAWNGRALSMREFDELFAGSAWFEPGLDELAWNCGAIAAYLAWHRTTAPHHNYVTGAAVVERNTRVWEEPAWKRPVRAARGRVRTSAAMVGGSLRQMPHLLRQTAAQPIRALGQRMQRLGTPRLESLPDAPDLFRAYRSWLRHPEVQRRPGGWEYRGRFYPDYLTVGGASHAIFREALRFCRGRGIDVGAGLWPFPGATPVDVWRGAGAGNSVSDIPDGTLDYVFSSHCLEHVENWREALAEWTAKLKPGGILFLYLPHPDCAIWQKGSPFVGDGHKWVPTPEILKQASTELGCEIVQSDDGPDAMFSFSICARKTDER